MGLLLHVAIIVVRCLQVDASHVVIVVYVVYVEAVIGFDRHVVRVIVL